MNSLITNGQAKDRKEAKAKVTAPGSAQMPLCGYCFGVKTPKEGAQGGFQVQFMGYYFFLYFAVITLVTAILKTRCVR